MTNIISNILSEELFTLCDDYSKDKFKDLQKLQTNIEYWDKEIVKHSSEVFLSRIDDKSILFEKLEGEIKKYVSQIRYKRCGISFYFWTKNSYIPWHYDLGRSCAITIYLNDDWHIDDGGLYLYKNNDTINAVVPEKNLGIVADYKTFHATSSIVENKIRRTIQIFLV